MSHSLHHQRLVLAVCLVISLVSLDAQQRLELGGNEPVPQGFTLIDGKLNPELIPQWRIWKTGLRTLASTKANKMDAFYGPLEEVLSVSEQAVLYKEANAQRLRDDRQIERAENEILQQPLTLDEKTKRLWPLELENRWASLNARDRLRDALSPESFAALTSWVNDLATELKILVPTHELEQFRQPQ
jgi:hypothetical protein